MEDRTILDLQKLKTISDKQNELRKEIANIREDCPCLDYEITGVESLSFDITPRAICPVCGKQTLHELSLQDKIDCLKHNLDFGDDTPYTEKDYINMAKEGGFIYPRFKG